VFVRDVVGAEPLVDRHPCLAAIVRPEGACRGDRDEDTVRVRRVQQDGVEAEAARARLPGVAGGVMAQAVQLLPGPATVGGFEEGSILDASVDRVRVVERRLEVPDTPELPRMRSAVVELVRA